jgi:predicted SAM-dependent methyltransferase
MAQEKTLKLHLGCGEKYLEGYWNIDFPEGEHSVMTPKVDEYADIRTLSYPEHSIDEIRSHHLFEHFSRAEALKLLTKWRSWLKPEGVLVIETPDFTTSAAFFLRSFSMKRKFQLARHIFGSQEAEWALHKDYWDKQKFEFVLRKMGFKDLKVKEYHNGLSRHGKELPGAMGSVMAHVPESVRRPFLNVAGNMLPERFYEKNGSNKMPNVLVSAKKDGNVRFDEHVVIKEILSLPLTGREGDRLLNVWLKEYEQF